MATNSGNVIRGAMEDYRSCKDWLDWYNGKLDEFHEQMKGRTTSSVIGMHSGTQDPNSVSRHATKVNDDLNQFKKRFESQYIHCNNTITLCDLKFLEVREEYKEIFSMRFVLGLGISEIILLTNYSQRRLYEIINEESVRLSF